MPNASLFTARLRKVARLFMMGPAELGYLWRMTRSGLFDPTFYTGAHPGLHPLYRAFPRRHFIAHGEAMGLQPNPDFSPTAYLRLNPDVARAGLRPFRHFLDSGRREGRRADPSAPESLPQITPPVLRFDPRRARAPVAVALHLYYPDLWDEFADRLSALDIAHDLFVTITYRGPESRDLARRIQERFPGAVAICLPNRGRDILPFVTLLNAGAFDGYAAVCKIHTKKSPHRQDGDQWRRHLVAGILPEQGLKPHLDAFLADPDAGIWVADGQHYKSGKWWGGNKPGTEALMRRIELAPGPLSFPAGSIYWAKPMVLGLIRSLRLTPEMFEREEGQVDGTLAHALERTVGLLTEAAGLEIRQTAGLEAPKPLADLPTPSYVSAFYLPQFHPIAQNDAWWGAGYTEWRAALGAVSMFPGHLQPMTPADLGYYDLRAPEVLGAQAALAQGAGVDAFCVYHYWFDPDRVLESPLDNLLRRPEIDFPFYLCWANESWRRNWDGLSGEVLLSQDYAPGFETRLVASSLPYMRDPRYQRPDGRRPRFVIYRPDDMPDAAANIAAMRAAWAAEGIDVELGAVRFHMPGASPLPEEAVDFWIEMPPHGLVEGGDYLFGGPRGNRMKDGPAPGFGGLIYDYDAVARRACSADHARALPRNTIAGIMPAWDNTARRGARAHIAHGGNPAGFRRWMRDLRRTRLDASYRGELFVNAWNEWAEKAVLEPSTTFGHLNLDVLREATGRNETWRG
jgi:lipopolysaccharide biosynthesis protein